MSVDLWTIGNVAIHLRHPPSRGALLRTGVHGGQDVEIDKISKGEGEIFLIRTKKVWISKSALSYLVVFAMIM